MMDTVVSPLFNPEVESMLCTLLMSTSFLFSLSIIFLAFLTVRIDDYVTWSWSVIWIPAWIINLMCFYTLLQYVFLNKNEKEQKEKEEVDEESKANEKLLDQCKKAILLIYFILFLIFQILIVVRLDGHFMTACVVFIPYFIIEAIHFLMLGLESLVGCLALISVGEHHRLPLFLFSQYWFNLLRFSQSLLIPLRIDHNIQCSWGLVFIPLYLIGLKWAIELAYRYYVFSNMPQPEIAHQGKITVCVGVVIFSVVSILFYTLVGLIAQRLDGLIQVRMSHVFVPLFIVFVSFFFFPLDFWFFFNFFFFFSRCFYVVPGAVFRVCYAYQQPLIQKKLKLNNWLMQADELPHLDKTSFFFLYFIILLHHLHKHQALIFLYIYIKKKHVVYIHGLLPKRKGIICYSYGLNTSRHFFLYNIFYKSVL